MSLIYLQGYSNTRKFQMTVVFSHKVLIQVKSNFVQFCLHGQACALHFDMYVGEINNMFLDLAKD